MVDYLSWRYSPHDGDTRGIIGVVVEGMRGRLVNAIGTEVRYSIGIIRALIRASALNPYLG